MTPKERVQIVLEAIEDVKYRIQEAISEDDHYVRDVLTEDLLALENCLVTEVSLFFEREAV